MSNENPRSGFQERESDNLKNVVAAITSAQKQQDELWTRITATRTKDGLIPLDWPLIREYMDSVRRTQSLLSDLETVGAQYEARYGKARQTRIKVLPATLPPRKPK